MSQFDWSLLIRHGHWITIGFGNRQVNVCARCTGTVLGFFSIFVLGSATKISTFGNLPFQEQLLICILLALPAGLDWLTQAYGVRESTNSIRGTTGFLEGVAVALFATAPASFTFKFVTILSIGSMILILGFIGKKALHKR
jgi:uncharacterized membrane protein